MSSRKEQLLTALLNGEKPEGVPQSRNEALLYALCEQGMGGGSGGGVSSWNDLTDNPFVIINVVSIDGETMELTCDKTSMDVFEAAQAGKVVFLTAEGMLLLPTGAVGENENGVITQADFGMLLNPSFEWWLDDTGILRPKITG